MTPNDFGKLLKNDLHGIFLFCGEELYLKQHYIKLARQKASSDNTNIYSLSGEGLSLSDVCRMIMDTASMPSMDMSKRFIHVYQICWEKIKEDDYAFFEDCANELKDYTDVVIIIDTLPQNFDAGSEKKPSKLFTKINKFIPCVFFAKETPARLAVWVQKHFAANKISADIDVCNALINYCGRDMFTLNNEVTKLSAYLLQNNRNKVAEEDIRNVSSITNEINTFDFTNAILDNQLERAFSIMSDMKLHKEKPELILGSIMKVYSDLYTVKIMLENGLMLNEISSKTKLHEYRAKIYIQRANALSRKGLEKALSLCHEADLKIKSFSFDSYNVLDILLIKLSMTGRLK